MNDRSNRGLKWAILPEKRELTLQDVEGFLLWMPVKRWSALRSNRSIYERKRTSRVLGLDFKNIEVVEYEEHLARARRDTDEVLIVCCHDLRCYFRWEKSSTGHKAFPISAPGIRFQTIPDLILPSKQIP